MHRASVSDDGSYDMYIMIYVIETILIVCQIVRIHIAQYVLSDDLQISVAYPHIFISLIINTIHVIYIHIHIYSYLYFLVDASNKTPKKPSADDNNRVAINIVEVDGVHR